MWPCLAVPIIASPLFPDRDLINRGYPAASLALNDSARN